jgi:hypothetical protein
MSTQTFIARIGADLETEAPPMARGKRCMVSAV